LIRRKLQDRGASAVEYGLLVAAIAATVAVVAFALGAAIEGTFHRACDAVAGAPNGGACPVPAGGGQVPPPQAPAPVAP
jgi:pilus assembly protein Flp/PilA